MIVFGDPNTILIGCITLTAVLLSLATAVIGLVTARRTAKNAAVKIQEVHVLVNSQLSTVMGRVDQLTKALNSAGVDIPTDPKNS